MKTRWSRQRPPAEKGKFWRIVIFGFLMAVIFALLWIFNLRDLAFVPVIGLCFSLLALLGYAKAKAQKIGNRKK